MSDAQVNIGVSNLSVLILRRVHRKARILCHMTGMPMSAVLSWWLDQMPESVTAKQQVELLTAELEFNTLHASKATHAPEPVIRKPDAEPFDIDQWVDRRTAELLGSLQLSPGQLAMAHQAAADMDRDHDANEYEF